MSRHEEHAPRIVRTVAELKAVGRELLEAAAAEGREASLGLVPTMGALHEGHARLIAQARDENAVVVVTDFVNRLQFDDSADFERYPRDLEADAAIAAGAGADLIFAPEEREVYPDGRPRVLLSAGTLGERFEGASRPGHFDGMLTVVAKLLHYGMPDPATPAATTYRAYFGQKDAQQLAIVRRLVHDLDYPVTIRPVPIVRSAGGLALSSRNRFLTDEQSDAALVLSRSLFLMKQRADARLPLQPAEAVAMIESATGVELDYFEVVDPGTLEPLAFNCAETPFSGEALVLVAARVGGVRLIDNMPLTAG
ncbi:pantoate--beta-alanine ligase [Zhihengliuella halotolerans]|uniref:Pantothenate synthetase n=1 Tax=Zhihengliuella halotolerans TaxID=370736 RepID=A0A4Q8AG23_9MICC|nr:pantoate--beta-alanine ligase [Zhihengliuella halotolerans]RZU63300.1 pantothenate synthetase [Zhihengliuella halotolerans]